MRTLWQDLRYGFRTLLRKPGFTAVAILTLALGIGANTAIFSIVNAVLLKPLPFREPDRLVAVWFNNTREGNPRYPFSSASFIDLRDQQQSFEGVAAYLTFAPASTMVVGGEPRSVAGCIVSPHLFSLLGVEPVAGRTFVPEEGQVGRDRVVVIGHGLWERAFGADPGVVGRAVTVNNQDYTVVGVVGPEFRFPSREVEVWTPLSFNPAVHPSLAAANRAAAGWGVIGRLKPGVTREAAHAELSEFARRLEEQFPQINKGFQITLVPLHEQLTGAIRPALLVLLGAVALVLLIACTNVATLLLARAGARSREMAVRASLGASRWRLVRQMLTESVALSALGGALGLLVAVWGVDFLLSMSPADIPRQEEIGVDLGVLAFALGVSVLTGIGFGLVPALQASRTDLRESLRDGARVAGGSGRRLRGALVVSEVALALVLLAGAGLLVRSFARLMEVSPGFETDKLIAVSISAPSPQEATPRQKLAFYRELFSRVEALPGVVAAGTTTRLPLSGKGVTTSLTVEGQPTHQGERPEIEFRRASANYFRAVGVPVVGGRAFTEQDTPDTPPVAVINEAAARRFFAGADPVGRRVRTGPNPNAPWMTVVGVVGDVRHFGLDAEPRPELYIASEQAPPDGPFMLVRTEGDPARLAPEVRALVRALNPDQPVGPVQTMNEVLSASVSQRRFNTSLLALLATLALALAALGLYGVVSFTVAQRTHEFGVRMALGAQRRDVLRLVLRHGMLLTLAGVAAGVAASFALTRVMSSLLYGVSATDPLTFAAVALLLAGVALLACYVPARRATKVDPMVALRYE